MERLKRSLIFVHRWLGTALCLMFLLWFPSGIVMMYWDFPSVGPADRLERSPALDSSRIQRSPIEAAAHAGVDPSPPVRLNMFDGRPVYRFGAGRRATTVYADTGDARTDISKETVNRIASEWTGQPVGAAVIRLVEDVDQWTIQTDVRNLQPLWKFSWPNGEQVYVSQASGEVVQYTTTASRWAAYLGAIPHWLYFTPLRKRAQLWSQTVIWLSGIGTMLAILGIVIGLWLYSPRKHYRRNGSPAAIPYRGWKRWHMVLGLIFGAGAATWAFSGMLSMDPFPTGQGAGASADAHRDAGREVQRALHVRAPLDAFSAKGPREALAQLGPAAVKELELASFAGEPMYLATLASNDTRIVPIGGEPKRMLDPQAMEDVITKAAQPAGGADVSVIDGYDRYYLDRHGHLPLPAVLAELHDPGRTRLYVDPKTGQVVGGYRASGWVSRWLYHGLHSLNFPWLYAYRPAWDIVVLTFMIGGTALSATSLMLAWGAIGRALGRS